MGYAGLALATLAMALGGRDGSVPPPSYGAYYALRIRVDPAAGTIVGEARFVFATAPPGPLRLFAGQALVIDSISVAGVRGTVARHGDTLVIEPPSATPRRRALDARVFYHGAGSPPALSFEAHNGSPAASTYGLPYSARAWWPAPGSTLAKADSADIVLTVPAPLVAVSNGRLVSTTTDAGWTTYHWATRHPIYPDVMSMAVANYVELRDSAITPLGTVPLHFYIYADDTAKARIDFARFPQILAFFSERFGPYPFADEKYGVTEFTTQSFREHQTVPSLGPRYFTGDRRNEWILAHELAHQWFGNSVSVRRWNDVWLNESLATYSAWLWKEHADGRAAYDSAIAQAGTRTFEGTMTIADSSDIDNMFGASTFFKGALMLHALRHLMGDERFFAALKVYVADHAYGLATAADFEQAMERGCGRPLSAFFQAWLTRPGGPPLVATWGGASCP